MSGIGGHEESIHEWRCTICRAPFPREEHLHAHVRRKGSTCRRKLQRRRRQEPNSGGFDIRADAPRGQHEDWHAGEDFGSDFESEQGHNHAGSALDRHEVQEPPRRRRRLADEAAPMRAWLSVPAVLYRLPVLRHRSTRSPAWCPCLCARLSIRLGPVIGCGHQRHSPTPH